MIVFIGDWVKTSNNKWKQVVDVSNDTFATIDADGELAWWNCEDKIEDSEDFIDHKSDTEMQALLKEA